MLFVQVYSFPLQQLQMLSDAIRINYAPAVSYSPEAIQSSAAKIAPSSMGVVMQVSERGQLLRQYRVLEA